MFFFIKYKPISIDCFTYRPEMQQFPIQETNKFFPEWWKNLPKTFRKNNSFFEEQNTMKRCVGFNNFFSRGITLPLWSDLKIVVENNNVVGQFSDRMTPIHPHTPEQRGEYLIDDYMHLKIVAPWSVRCKEKLDWAFVQNTWCFDKPDEFIIPPGIFDFNYQSSVNVNMFIMGRARYRELQLHAGTPMVNIIPLTHENRKVKIHTHVVTEQEFRGTQLPGNFAFIDAYKKYKDSQVAKEKKCPFH